MPEGTKKWLVCAQPVPDAKLRLLCIPYSGSGASIFRAWSQELPPFVEVWAAQLPGREERRHEAPLRSLNAVVCAVADNLGPTLTGPFAFFGHSTGALVAFELARELRRRGQVGPRHLFVSGRRAPQVSILDPLHLLPEAQLVAKLKSMGGIPEAVWREPDLVQMFLPVIRADLTINEAEEYRFEEPLDCPISVYGGLSDELASAAALEAWREQTHGEFQRQMFAGNHFFIQSARAALMKSIAQTIASMPQ